MSAFEFVCLRGARLVWLAALMFLDLVLTPLGGGAHLGYVFLEPHKDAKAFAGMGDLAPVGIAAYSLFLVAASCAVFFVAAVAGLLALVVGAIKLAAELVRASF